MRQQRRVILRLDDFAALRKSLIHVAEFTNYLPRLARRLLQLFLISVRVPNAVRALLPLDLQLFPPCHGAGGLTRQHRHAAKRLKADGWLERIDRFRLLHSGDAQRRFVVHRLHGAAEDRRTRHARIEHSFHARILPIRRFAGAHVFQVVARRAFSDVAPLASCLEFYLLFLRHLELSCRCPQFSIAQFPSRRLLHHSIQIRAASRCRHPPPRPPPSPHPPPL